MNGISAIIAIVLILMIVVAMASLTYVFSSGIFTLTTSSTEQSINRSTQSLLANMKVETMSANSVYVRNVGQSDLTEFSVYINDVPAQFSVNPPVIKPGNLGTITIKDFIKENDDIKITNAQGVSSTKKAPDPCDEAALCLKFDEGSGTTAKDSSPYGNDGTIYESNWITGKKDYFEEAESKSIGSAGTIVSDGTASGGIAVMGTAGGTSGTIVFGPYDKTLPAGTYSVSFRLRVSSNLSSSDVVTIDVFDSVQGTLAIRNLKPNMFYANDSSPRWQTFTLIFSTSGSYGNGLEYRVRVFQPTVGTNLYVDYISVTGGKYGSALSFDGINDKVSVPDKPILNPPNVMSISLWAYRRDAPQNVWSRMVAKEGATSSYNIWVDASNAIAFSVLIGGGWRFVWSYQSGGRILQLNKWSNIVAIYNNSYVSLCLDGNCWTNTTFVTGNIDPSIGIPVTIGDSSYTFDGLIDEVRVYNKAIY